MEALMGGLTQAGVTGWMLLRRLFGCVASFYSFCNMVYVYITYSVWITQPWHHVLGLALVPEALFVLLLEIRSSLSLHSAAVSATQQSVTLDNVDICPEWTPRCGSRSQSEHVNRTRLCWILGSCKNHTLMSPGVQMGLRWASDGPHGSVMWICVLSLVVLMSQTTGCYKVKIVLHYGDVHHGTDNHLTVLHVPRCV